MRHLILTFTTLLVLGVPSVLWACNYAPCGSPIDSVPTAKKSLPANGGFLLHSTYTVSDEPLMLVNDQTREVLDYELGSSEANTFRGRAVRTLMPAQELEPGQRYTLHTPNTSCDDEWQEHPVSIPFVATQPAELPDSLGVLSIVEQDTRALTVANSGSCFADIRAGVARVELALSESALPWRNALSFETYVDDNPWFPASSSGQGPPLGQSWKGRARDTIFSVCNGDPRGVEHDALYPGIYSVYIQARLAGTDQVWQSNTVEVDLRCEPLESNEEPTERSESPNLIHKTPEPMIGARDDVACSAASGSSSGLMLMILMALAVRFKR